MAIENVEFIDCGSVSIQYDATGQVSVSFVVVTNNYSLTKVYTSLEFGGVRFIGSLMSAVQKPIMGSGGWYEWQMQIQGVGN